MDSNNLKFLITLNSFPKFGSIRIKKLRKYFKNNFELAYNSNADDLIKAGINENVTFEFLQAKQSMSPSHLIDSLNKEGINVISLADDNYPKILKEIYDPPEILYYKGNIEKINNYNIGIVGTRKISKYGQQITEEFSYKLASKGISIISGMALGVDTVAHDSAIRAKGCTIAILGTGIDQKSIYPKANTYLSERIINSGGMIISEFPMGTPPLKQHFPQRNRLISGLSQGIIVIEAGEKSGALITARYALEQNREVFAVPGNIYSSVSKGPNNLIKEGARLVTCANDITEELNIENIDQITDAKQFLPENKEEELILNALSSEPMHIDKISSKTNINIKKTSSTLVMMEMKGMVKNMGGMEYILLRL